MLRAAAFTLPSNAKGEIPLGSYLQLLKSTFVTLEGSEMQTNLKNTVSLTSAHDQHRDKVCESDLNPYYKNKSNYSSIQLARKQLWRISDIRLNQQCLEELGPPIPNHFAYLKKKNTVTKSPDCIPEV